MAAKRRIRERQIEEEAVDMKKRALIRMEDRLSNLPEDLQVRILSFLDIKQAVQTSALSRKWNYLWTLNPVLEFNDFGKVNLYVFDKFVDNVLRVRDQSCKLDRLIFTRRGASSAKVLNKVFNYAFSHGVKQLEATIGGIRNGTWPVCNNYQNIMSSSLESLTSLKLQGDTTIGCPFLLGKTFKNLTVLYLKGAFVSDEEPFSGFPVLEKLTLLNCDIVKTTLHIHASHLTDLSISGHGKLDGCELMTPRLRFFGYRGYNFPLIRDQSTLPLLDTLAIDFNGALGHLHDKQTFDDLVALFCALPNATSLKLFWPTVKILCFFQDELVKQLRWSPFRNLKCLKLDFRSFQYQNLHRPGGYCPCPSLETFQIPTDVKAYFFINSPNDAKVTWIYPDYWKLGIVHYFDASWKIKDVLISRDIF